MHVRGVAGKQDAFVAVSRGLPRHIGEPRDPRRVMNPVVGPACGDERLAEIAQGGFGRGSDVLFGHHDTDRSRIFVHHLAVADLVLHSAEGMNAERIAVDAQFRLLRHLDLGDQVTGRRIPSGKFDAGCLADQTASTVAPDEILRAQRPAVG